MSVFVLRLNGAQFLAESFRHTMRTASAVFFSSDCERDAARRLLQCPALVGIGIAGSVNQMLRYHASTHSQNEFTVEEHVLGGPPGSSTLRRRFDLLSGLDPSYELQVALWSAVAGSIVVTPDSVASISSQLEARVRVGIASMQLEGMSEQEAVDTLRETEVRMGGIHLVPTFGKASTILEKLPTITSDIFKDVARQIDW